MIDYDDFKEVLKAPPKAVSQPWYNKEGGNERGGRGRGNGRGFRGGGGYRKPGEGEQVDDFKLGSGQRKTAAKPTEF